MSGITGSSVTTAATGAPTTGTFVTSTNQAGSLPNSRTLTAGTNITLDASVANVLTVNAAGGGGGGSTVPTTVQGDTVFASATNVLSALAKNTSATRYLANTGTSNNPAWGQVNLANGVTGTLPVTNVAAAGSDTYVQYNSVGAFAGDVNFTWDATNKVLTVGDTAQGTIQPRAGASTLILRGGNATSTAGGAISVAGGVGASGQNGGTGFYGGGTGGASGGSGGTATFQGGTGGSTSGPGGLANLVGGTGASPNGNSGGIAITSGSPAGTGTVGSITFSIPSTATQTGSVIWADTSGDDYVRLVRSPATASYTDVVLQARGRKGTSTGLAFTVQGGMSSTAPGTLTLTGGDSTGGGATNGGDTILTGGAPSGAGVRGKVLVNNSLGQGSALKHQRVTTGSIGAGTSSLVTLTWTTTFADANYTVVASVEDSTAAVLSLHVIHIETKTASAVAVRIENTAAGALTGTLDLIAMHD